MTRKPQFGDVYEFQFGLSEEFRVLYLGPDPSSASGHGWIGINLRDGHPLAVSHGWRGVNDREADGTPVWRRVTWAWVVAQ